MNVKIRKASASLRAKLRVPRTTTGSASCSAMAVLAGNRTWAQQ